MTTIPLARAYHCLDCDTISDNSLSCPACGSTTQFPLASWINRPAVLTGIERELATHNNERGF